jgi:hypothetical protein
VLVADFVRNAEAQFTTPKPIAAAPEAAAAASTAALAGPVSVFALLMAALKSWLRARSAASTDPVPQSIWSIL